MAELLIRAADTTHPDPEKDRRGSYKRGDVVVVMPDGYAWGLKERRPKFHVIKLPGIAPSVVSDLVDFQTVDDDGNALPEPEVWRRRNWRLFIDDLPPGLLVAMTKNDVVATTPAIIRRALRRVRDNTRYRNL